MRKSRLRVIKSLPPKHSMVKVQSEDSNPVCQNPSWNPPHISLSLETSRGTISIAAAPGISMVLWQDPLLSIPMSLS